MIKNTTIVCLLTLIPLSEVLAKQDYTYVQSTLAFPWFIFFVIFILILIPFVMVIVLSWKKPETEIAASGTANVDVHVNVVASYKSIFNRFVLPSLLTVIGIFSILLVLNAYEAMDLMEHFGTAAPTMLNARP